MQEKPVLILTCGGTIDKVYFDDASEFQVGEPEIGQVLKNSHATIPYRIVSLMQKDSLNMTDEDREIVRKTVLESSESRILITHGTDSMVSTARALLDIPEKTIVLTGALQPAKFRVTDAIFNIGCALTAVQTLASGCYIVMNGRVFDPLRVQKNREEKIFEEA